MTTWIEIVEQATASDGNPSTRALAVQHLRELAEELDYQLSTGFDRLAILPGAVGVCFESEPSCEVFR